MGFVSGADAQFTASEVVQLPKAAGRAAVIPAGDVRAVLYTANQVVAADAESIATIRGEGPNTLGDSET
jgi:hypothetical protein